MASKISILLLYFSACIHFMYGVPEPGVKEFTFDKEGRFKSFAKSLFKDAKITISGVVDSSSTATTGELQYNKIVLKWYLLHSDCAQNFIHVEEDKLSTWIGKIFPHPLHTEYKNGSFTFSKEGHLSKKIVDLERGASKKSAETTAIPTTASALSTTTAKPKVKKNLATHKKTNRHKRDVKKVKKNLATHKKTNRHKRDVKKPDLKSYDKKGKKSNVVSKTTPQPQQAPAIDGNYLLVLEFEKNHLLDGVQVQVKVDIKMNTGYLSAAEWPLLPFYGAMSLVYLAYGMVWLIVSACQWRELLRIQFWIGGVIALGMLEKAILFSEYNNVNDTGVPAHGLVVLALVLSCIKRTLSRILIIIVSMGFGIVKPRLGAALHRVLGVGCLYFVLSIVEGSYREFSVKADVNRKQIIASVPLSVLDAVICWWIFMSLLQTMRTLRIRKNLVKLSLYRHFTNILAVSVVASVAFMVWVIKVHSFNSCIKDWKEIWIDDAFWHFLFALILLAIMILWRPTANNQRYAFTPLIDVGEDDDDDMTLSDAFQGMKMRGKSDGEAPSRAEKQRKKAEDDLKWVEENIPTSGGIDTALPSLLDSDEEMMTTKLEMNKME